MRRAIFVTATDTGVGKTVISGLLCLALQKKGIDCGMMKPVESGSAWSDGEFLKKISKVKDEISLVSPYRFKQPLAPYLAALLEKKEIEVERIKGAFNDLLIRHQMVIVEGAGGLFVPQNKNLLTADLIKELNIPMVIVSRLSLGTINHTLLTIEAAKNMGIEILGVVFNQPVKTKKGICERTNPDIISKISGVPVLGVIPYLPGVSVEKGRIQGLQKAIKNIQVNTLLQERKTNTARLKVWDKEYIWHPFTQMRDWLKDRPLIIKEGSGSFIKDTEGKWYLDGVSSLWVNLHGHRRKELDQALRKQINRISHSTLLGLSNIPSIELAKRLIDIAPGKLKKVFYSDCGSTAVEIALKIAFQYWQQKSSRTRKKTRFIRFVNAYHGDTVGAVSVGGIDMFHKVYHPLLFKSFKASSPYCYRCHLGLNYPQCKFKCLEETAKILRRHQQTIAGLIIEPLVYAAAGMLTQPAGFLKKIEWLCRKYNVLLICDEVATGFGRTGRMFACDKEGVRPDILCLAKGISAGYLPLAATLTTQEIFNAFLGDFRDKKTFFHGHTYTGNPLACSVAIASLDIFDKERVLQRLQPKITHLKNGLQSFLQLKHVGETRQQGFMVGIELVKDRQVRLEYNWKEKIGIRVCREARRHGVILRPLGNVIVLMPPLSISIAELDKLLEAAYKSIEKITENED